MSLQRQAVSVTAHEEPLTAVRAQVVAQVGRSAMVAAEAATAMVAAIAKNFILIGGGVEVGFGSDWSVVERVTW